MRSPDYLAILADTRCPTCGHSLATPTPHCGEEESHVRRRTQDEAKRLLRDEFRLAPGDDLDAALSAAGKLPPADPWATAAPDGVADRTTLLRDLTTPPRGVSQREAARMLRLDETTVRKWLASPGASSRRDPPWCAVELLRRLVTER